MALEDGMGRKHQANIGDEWVGKESVSLFYFKKWKRNNKFVFL